MALLSQTSFYIIFLIIRLASNSAGNSISGIFIGEVDKEILRIPKPKVKAEIAKRGLALLRNLAALANIYITTLLKSSISQPCSNLTIIKYKGNK